MRDNKGLAQSLQATPQLLQGWRKIHEMFSPAAVRTIRRVSLLFLFGISAGPLIGFTVRFFAPGEIIGIAGGESLPMLLIFYMASGALMSFACYVTCGLPAEYIHRALRHYPKYVQVPFRALMGFAGTVLGLLISWQVLSWIFHLRLIGEESLHAALILTCILGSLLTLIITVFVKMRAEIRLAERRLYESKLKEQMLAERTAVAQLRALQAQINPHFFFNTLSSIVSLLSIDTAAAKEVIIALAEMYRYTLRCTNTRLVPLEEELEFVKSYLGIEEVRFRNRLKLDIQTPGSLHSLKIPGLVLQPIVENAIKHGIANNIGSGLIQIAVDRGDQDFTVVVSNTTEQRPELRTEDWLVEGHALKNVADRLSAIYATRYELNLEAEDDLVRVRLRLPIHKNYD